MPVPSTAKNLSDFSPLKWVAPYLTSPDWVRRERARDAAEMTEASDRFNRDTMFAFDGVQHWVEMYPRPAPGTSFVPRSISLVKFGTGLNGFPGIAHGGAVMTLIDEALGFAMVANEMERQGGWIDGASKWKQKFDEGRPPMEVLEGFIVTAKLEVKFLKPVLCPGIVGIEAEVLENKGHKMKIKATMRDGEGVPLVQAESLWVRIGGPPKGKL
jgi:acyl-coenzyme A thioesterase PaaI-like protein